MVGVWDYSKGGALIIYNFVIGWGFFNEGVLFRAGVFFREFTVRFSYHKYFNEHQLIDPGGGILKNITAKLFYFVTIGKLPLMVKRKKKRQNHVQFMS